MAVDGWGLKDGSSRILHTFLKEGPERIDEADSIDGLRKEQKK